MKITRHVLSTLKVLMQIVPLLTVIILFFLFRKMSVSL